jgi:hypothetical protein
LATMKARKSCRSVGEPFFRKPADSRAASGSSRSWLDCSTSGVSASSARMAARSCSPAVGSTAPPWGNSTSDTTPSRCSR